MSGTERLARATSALGKTQRVLDELALWLNEGNPRVRIYCCIYRNHPALEISVSAHARWGQLQALDGVHDAFAESPTAFDRWSVQTTQANRWVPVFPAVIATRKLLGAWGGTIGPQDRVVLCQGTKPLGYVSASLDVGQAWSAAERQAIRLRYRRVSSLLRLAALDWRARHEPNELSESLNSDRHGAFVAGVDGRVLAASPSARHWWAQSGELAELIEDAEKRGWSGAEKQRLSGFELERTPIDTSSGRSFQIVRCVRETERPVRIATVPLKTLTPRERELCAWIASGETNAKIADRMAVQPSTIKTMLERVYGKLEVSGRVALAHRLLRAS